MMSQVTDKPQDDSTEFDVSSSVIAANEDLLSQILVRLPIKSLSRFKSVSKDWLSLIATPQFRLLKSRRPFSGDVSGILLRRISSRYLPYPEYDFISLVENRKQAHSPLERLDFVDDERGLDVVQYCNGLLLCETSGWPAENVERKFFVFNPTTKEYTTVSANRKSSLIRAFLAFDPRKSPHYKVIFLYCYSLLGTSFRSELGIYSSETGILRQVDCHIQTKADFLSGSCFSNGLYWNGAINWINFRRDSLYLNVDEERLGMLPMPPVMEGREGSEWIRYHGESNGHLHLIETNSFSSSQLIIYEMDTEYSRWFVMLRLDLQPIIRSFPEKVDGQRNPLRVDTFGIMAMVRKDDDEKSFLVLSVPGKVIRLDLKDNGVTTVCELLVPHNLRSHSLHNCVDSIQFIESFHPL